MAKNPIAAPCHRAPNGAHHPHNSHSPPTDHYGVVTASLTRNWASAAARRPHPPTPTPALHKTGIEILTSRRESGPTPHPLLLPFPRPRQITLATLPHPHPQRKYRGRQAPGPRNTGANDGHPGRQPISPGKPSGQRASKTNCEPPRYCGSQDKDNTNRPTTPTGSCRDNTGGGSNTLRTSQY